MRDTVHLRHVDLSDLPVFYEQQLDAAATAMAGFPSRDRAAFDAHWKRNVLGSPTSITRTIVMNGEVAGYIGSWPQDGVRLVGYWIGREYWGQGVATQALAEFLHIVSERPLLAHVVRTNAGSIRVLEKCGFGIESDSVVETDAEHDAELVLVLR